MKNILMPCYINNYNVINFSIAVLSIFSELHHREKLKTKKRSRSPNNDNTTEIEPIQLEIGIPIEVISIIIISIFNVSNL